MSTLTAKLFSDTGRGSFAWSDLRSALEARRERRRTYLRIHRELSASSDRDLADIGISRHDIPEIATRAAHGI